MTYAITGNTYNIRKNLKGWGCKWDAATKSWITDNERCAEYYKKFADIIVSDHQINKEQAWDNLHNEGAEGYNPYRDGMS